MSHQKHVPRFDSVKRVTFSFDPNTPFCMFHVHEEVFPTGHHEIRLEPSNEESKRTIKHWGGELEAFLGKLLQLPGVEQVKVANNKFTVCLIDAKEWSKTAPLLMSLLPRTFSRAVYNG